MNPSRGPCFSDLLPAPLAPFLSFPSLLPPCLCSRRSPFAGHSPCGISEVPGTLRGQPHHPLELGSPQLKCPPTARTSVSAGVDDADGALAVWPMKPAAVREGGPGRGGGGVGLTLTVTKGSGRTSRH